MWNDLQSGVGSRGRRRAQEKERGRDRVTCRYKTTINCKQGGGRKGHWQGETGRGGRRSGNKGTFIPRLYAPGIILEFKAWRERVLKRPPPPSKKKNPCQPCRKPRALVCRCDVDSDRMLVATPCLAQLVTKQTKQRAIDEKITQEKNTNKDSFAWQSFQVLT